MYSGTKNLRLQRLQRARLYLCTDARRERGDFAEFIAAALTGGVDIIQLRDKGSPGEKRYGPLEAAEELQTLALLQEIAQHYGALVAVNDRADIAHLAQADVLHLGQDDLPVAAARSLVGSDMIIGRSTHDEQQARAAACDRDVDYFCTGPCWPTPTKPGRTAPGLPLVRQSSALLTDKPWFAIGGIDSSRLGEVLTAGASRIVVVRAITEAEDPYNAAKALSDALARKTTNVHMPQ
ncbi:MAG: thiamine phosphate synthase [Mycobacteriaceae bacterium]